MKDAISAPLNHVFLRDEVSRLVVEGRLPAAAGQCRELMAVAPGVGAAEAAIVISSFVARYADAFGVPAGKETA